MTKKLLLLQLLFAFILQKSFAQCTLQVQPTTTNVSCTGTLGSINLAPTGAQGDLLYYTSTSGSADTLWADHVIGFKAEYSTSPGSWSAFQILGHPNVYPAYGDISNAYIGDYYNRNYIEVGFATPIYVSEVDVYETYSPGTIDTVYVRNAVTGVWNMVWQGTAHGGLDVATIFKAQFPTTTYKVDAVRFTNDGSKGVDTYEEFDAICIIGSGLQHIYNGAFTGLGNGDYSYILTDSAGCSVTTNVLTIATDPGVHVLGTTVTNPLCYGANATGSAVMTIVDAIGAYSYTIADTVLWGSTVLGFSTEYSNSPGNWSAFQILGPPNVYPTYGDIPEAYLGDNYGGRDSIAVGFAPLYNVQEVNIYETSTPGTIDSVFIRNAVTGQWSLVWHGVPFAGPPVATVFKVTFPALNYPADGVAFTVDGSVFDDYNEFDAISIINYRTGTSNILNNLPLGAYNVILTDAAGCTDHTNINIVAPAPLTSNAYTNGNLNCHNDFVLFNVNEYGGTGIINTTWANNFNPNQVQDTLYHLYTMTDENGCTKTDSIRNTQILPATQFTTSYITTPSACAGAGGTVSFSLTGGETPYSLAFYGDSTNLAAGSYFYDIFDNRGCESTGHVVISDANAPQITPTVTNPLCAGQNNGSVTFNITGGTPAYTLNTFGIDTNAISAGTNSVKVTDANGCVGYASYTAVQPNYIDLNSTTTAPKCFGDSTGTAIYVAIGGTAPYTYEISGGHDYMNLAAGSYTMTVTDSHGCTQSQNFGIYEENTPVNASVTTLAASCFGSSDGIVLANVTGGTPNFSYDYGTANNLAVPAGNYTLIVIDHYGCKDTVDYTITSPTAIQLNVTTTNANCNGASTGSVAYTVTGGTPGYLVSNTAANPTAIAAGTYSITVTDTAGCTATSPYTITEPSAITIAITTTSVLCNGGNTGTVSTVVTGGTPGYLITNTATNPTALAAGTYSISVTDTIGCTATSPYTITEPNAVTLTLTTTNVLCHGGNTGTVSAVATGGTPAYSYNYGSVTPTAVAAGTNSVTVTDNSGCTATANYTVSEPAAIVVTGTPTAVTSAGNNGAVTTTISGGVAPYTYHWNNNATTQNITGLVAGTYTITVTDANGCTSTGTYVVAPYDGINDLQNSTSVNLMPNPTSGLFTIKSEKELGNVSVYNALGESVYFVKTNQSTLTIDLSDFASGIYMVKVNNVVKKIVKE